MCKCGIISKLSGDSRKEGLGSIRKREWWWGGTEEITNIYVLISKEERIRMLQGLFTNL